MIETVEPAKPLDAVNPSEVSPPIDRVTVSVQRLPIGCRLEHPIHDASGVLLLAAGLTITDRFKELLASRSIVEVQLSQTDAESLRAGSTVPPAGLALDPEFTRQLDRLIESGSLFVANTGPNVRDSLVMHGCRAYNSAERERLIARHESTAQTLDSVLQEALRGNNVSGGAIAEAVGAYVTELTSDTDCVLATAQEASRHQRLSSHALQMSLLGMSIGIEMGLDEHNVRQIGLAGLVHDWGMLRVAQSVREADCRLTEIEFLEIKRHPIYSLELLQKVAGIPTIVALVTYQVHESPSGDGYPRGRTSKAIHPFASILHVADIYLALTEPRPYREPLMRYAAMECVLRHAREKSVDPDIARHLLHVLSLFPIGSYVVLSDGSIGRVARRNGNDYMRPHVLRLCDADGHATPADGKLVDLREQNLRILKALPTPGGHEAPLTELVLQNRRPI